MNKLHCWGFRHLLNCMYYRAVLYLSVLETNRNCANSSAWENEGIEPGFYFRLCCGEQHISTFCLNLFFFLLRLYLLNIYSIFCLQCQFSSHHKTGHRVLQQGDNLKRLVCTKCYEMSTFIQIKLLPKAKFYTLFPNWIQSFSFFCPAHGITLPVWYHCLNMVGSAVCCKDSERGTNARFYTLSFSVLFRNCSRESKESWVNFRPSVDFKTISS